MEKEQLAFWASFSAAVITALGNIAVTLLARKPPGPKDEGSTKLEGHATRTHRNLKRWPTIINIVWALASLASLAYVVWQPGAENRWFVRIHITSVVIATLSGIAILIFTISFGKMRLGKKLGERKEELRTSFTIFCFLVFLAAFAYIGVQFWEWEGLSPSSKLKTAGFALFNSEDYRVAVVVSEMCGTEFHRAAARVEETLAGKQIPNGKVPTAEREAIFGNGVLNDVAACYWIKARSAQTLGQTDEARSAYNRVLEFPHARVWDPKGWFWSPAEDAQDRLMDLR